MTWRYLKPATWVYEFSFSFLPWRDLTVSETKNRTMSGILRVSLPIEFHQAFSTPLVDTSEMYRSYQSHIHRPLSNITGIHVPPLLLCPPRPMPNQNAWYQCYQQAPTARKHGMANSEVISSVNLDCPTRGDYFLDSSFLSSSACRKCACTWAYVICGETSPSWLCRDEYQWVSGCASCICWTVVLRVSSRPTADVWNTRCNAEWWRHLLNQFMEIWVPTKHSSRASIAQSYVRPKNARSQCHGFRLFSQLSHLG